MDKNKLRRIKWSVNIPASNSLDGKAQNSTLEGLFHRWISRGNVIVAIVEDSSGLIHFVDRNNYTEFRFLDSLDAENAKPQSKMVM